MNKITLYPPFFETKVKGLSLFDSKYYQKYSQLQIYTIVPYKKHEILT